MKLGYRQMDVHDNLNLHNYSFGCVGFIKHRTLDLVGISLRLDMEKENTMVQEHV